MTRACLSVLAGMYALQLSSFAGTSGHLNAAFLVVLLLLITRCWLLLAGFVVGLGWFFLAAEELIASRIPAAIEGDSLVVEIKVVDFPSTSGATSSFLVQPLDDARLPARVRLSWYEPPVSLHHGDRWRLEVRLRRPRGARNPGGFDFEAWLFRERMAATGYVVNGHRNRLLPPLPSSAVDQLQRRFVGRVVALIENPEPAAVLIALVVGTRHLLSDAQWQRYATTGTSHLMAISGLHIGLAAGGAYLLALFAAGLLSVRARQRNHRRAAIVCSVVVALWYATIAGFAVPARRASLMLLLVGGAAFMHRKPKLAAIVSAAALLIALLDPLATMTPGFMLSFAAVALLIWVARRRAGLATLQLMLLCGLLPLVAVLFDRVSLAALPVNLLAVPLFAFVTVPLSLLGLVLDGALQPLGDLALLLAARSITLLEKGLTLFAALPLASITVPALTGVAWLSIIAPGLWALLPPGWPGRPVAWLGLVALLLHQPGRPGTGCARVSILDVGQGLAVVIETHRRTLLYDTGPAYRSGGNAAANVVLPYLAHRGVRELDRLLVSHADLDHAGGVGAILDSLPVHEVLAGEPLAGVRTLPCRAGQNWSYDGVEFEVLYPPLLADVEGNNRSCVLQLSVGEHRLLLTGDIEASAEQELTRTRSLLAVDAVVVPHHGSRTSSTPPFVEALQASIAIVSSGYNNHWGLPKPDIVQRWQAAGADVLNTATAGAIELSLCAASGLESIRRYRHDNRRIWHE
ncbi:MAG: DNA internalization-related competence protein ComEC/Rec2 [Gammaproteobacteria bacterium]|nr:DNA internalization-related competence protein ComEC/Rec2 [Gammaproteobacteria bacterium]MDH5303243.1 DNA internalization-related competence protein ComEC/Rec2 [Gammaproteobacteria bacterium]MDH5322557.1 DNA internalization-related competence protein ComEC/Rec2 [Gammaproteobacteria bacterium]